MVNVNGKGFLDRFRCGKYSIFASRDHGFCALHEIVSTLGNYLLYIASNYHRLFVDHEKVERIKKEKVSSLLGFKFISR